MTCWSKRKWHTMLIRMLVTIAMLSLPASAMWNLDIDSSSIAKRVQRVKKLKQNAQRITRDVEQSVVQSLIPDKPQPVATLTPPEELFAPQQEPRRVVAHQYISSGKYVTKADLNGLVDSLTREFKSSLNSIRGELDQFHDVANMVLDQNAKQNDKQNDLYAWITGGGLTAFVTALTGFFVLFRRRKNAAADFGGQKKQIYDEIIQATLKAEREAREGTASGKERG